MFTFYTDPGHGWLQVNKRDCLALGLRAECFSRCSYRKGDTYYLEEDCDAVKFLSIYKLKNGREPILTEVYQERTFIRKLPSLY